MWRVCLAYLSHRAILFGVLLLGLNQGLPTLDKGKALPEIASFTVLKAQFYNRMAQTAESQAVQGMSSLSWPEVFAQSKNPFFWLGQGLVRYLGLQPWVAVVFLSNLFLLLFLWELFTLSSRSLTLDTAAMVPVLVVLWPTSYELSLGSQLSLNCFLTLFTVRNALDDRWMFTGLTFAVLALVEPFAVVLLPLLLYNFWFFQRHYSLLTVLRRTLFLVLPFGLMWLWKGGPVGGWLPTLRGSAIDTLIVSVGNGKIFSVMFGEGLAQTLTLVFFGVGAVAATMLNGEWNYRVIPALFFGILIAFSPYGSLATRALISGACLQGIASLSAPPVYRLIQAVLLVLGAIEVFNSFSLSVG